MLPAFEEGNSMDRRSLVRLCALASGISAVSPVWAQLNLGKMIEAGTALGKSEAITDEELKARFDQLTADMDRKHKVAGAGTPHGKRLAALTSGLGAYDGLSLNFKAYATPEVNAFAMANGTVRVYTGLMDKFTDDEIRYVIGHEIGHVKAGHTKARMQTALRTGALRTAVAATGGKAGAIADSQLGDLFEKVVRAQHSQGNEREADDYAMKFMKRNKYAPQACVTALEKLDGLSGGGGAHWLSTHPSPRERAQRMKAQVA
jgi:putative metalloprotease